MLENSVILFSTDNGGAVESSSNKPLRGNKESVYEGGVRGVGLLAGGALPPLQSHQSDQSVRVSHFSQQKVNIFIFRLIYITDWFKTFLKLGGVDTKSLPPNDSKNMWRVVTRNKVSRRREIVLNLDTDPENGLWSAAIRSRDLKLIWGQDKLLKQRVGSGQWAHYYWVIADPREG